MLTKTVAILFIAIILTALFAPVSAHAFALDPNTIKNIVSIFKAIYKGYETVSKVAANVPHKFIFGGHITHSEGGCSLKFTTHTRIVVLGVPVVVPIPGLIPLGGNTIEVGPPVNSPGGQMFTFPGITDIYRNNSQGRVGPWALGIGFAPFPIDKINDALGKLPSIPPGGCGQTQGSEFCVDNFHLDCSDNNKNVILKIGTSK